MKIKLIQPGFEHYTGDLGPTAFFNGVSVSDVSTAEARLLAAIMPVVDAETGRGVGDLQTHDDQYRTAAVSETLPTLAEIRARRAASLAPLLTLAAQVMPQVPAPVTPAAPVEKHTHESLAAVADAKGIAGLRAIAGPLGVKGKAIQELITEILAAQDTASRGPTFIEGAEPVVIPATAEPATEPVVTAAAEAQ